VLSSWLLSGVLFRASALGFDLLIVLWKDSNNLLHGASSLADIFRLNFLLSGRLLMSQFDLFHDVLHITSVRTGKVVQEMDAALLSHC
jgi:hypothetical protein